MAVPQTHCHGVQFYRDRSSLAVTVARFLSEGLRVGQPAIIVATPDHAAAILSELETLNLDVSKLRETAELQVFDAARVLSSFMIGSQPDALMFKSNVGDMIDRLCANRDPCPIRVYGEMVDLLWRDGNSDAAIRLEILWNQLASAYDFSLLCGYAAWHFYREMSWDAGVADICQQHSHVVEDPNQISH
jgi:hypothetical protein